jgi:catalase
MNEEASLSSQERGPSRRDVFAGVTGLSIAALFADGVCPFSTAAAAPLAELPSTDSSVEALAEKVVDTLEAAYGVHPGLRRNHTKGFGVLGTFVGTQDAARISRSPLFGGEAIEVVGRFSIAGGDPEAGDPEKSPRGFAMEFRLPGGALQHITMLHTPMFFAKVPATFLAKFTALIPDPATFKAFEDSHPDNASQTEFLAKNNPPPGYANAAYYGIHTFKFIDRNDKVTQVRFWFEPEDGEKHLTDAQLETMPRDFLEAGHGGTIAQRAGEMDHDGRYRGGWRPRGRPDRVVAK